MIQPESSNNVRISRIHQRRSLNNKHKHSSTKQRQPSTIIHVNIGTLGNVLSVNTKSNLDKQRSNQSVIVTKIPRYHRNITNKSLTTVINPTRIPSDQTDSVTTNSKTGSYLSKSSLVTPDTKNKNDWSDQKGMTIDYHQQPKNNKKTKCSRRCAIISILITIFIILIIATILLVLLIKPTSTTTTIRPTYTPLLRWNSSGITVAGIDGSPGNTSTQLNNPFDIILDYAYNLYIADYMNHRIQKYSFGSSTGQTVAGNGTAGSSQYQLNMPTRVIIDSNGNLYISDSANNRTQFWANGAMSGTTLVGTTNSSGSSYNQLKTPYGLALDPSSNELYILDNGNNRIVSYSLDTYYRTLVFGTNASYNLQLNYARGLCFDSFSNSFIIANANSNNILRYILGANSLTLVAGDINGTPGTTSTLFNSTNEATLDPMGNLYVADRYNHRIQFFYPDQSNGTTIAGISTVPGNNITTLKNPRSVRLDNQLNLYVADAGNNRIQKFLRY